MSTPSLKRPRPAIFPRVSLNDLESNNGELLQAALLKHSFAVLTDLRPQDAAAIHDALRGFRLFFDTEPKTKKVAEMGPSTDWDFGYIGQNHKKQPREQFHCVADSLSSGTCLWPSTPPSFRVLYLGAMEVLESVLSRVCSVLIPTIHHKWIEGKAMKPSYDLSIMDAFFYPNVKQTPGDAQDSNSPAHCDPGLFTVGPFTPIQGFQVFDRSTEQWLDANEDMGGTTDLLLICNEYLEQLSEKRVVCPMYKACTHRVSWSTMPRVSMMYERRYELESDESEKVELVESAASANAENSGGGGIDHAAAGVAGESLEGTKAETARKQAKRPKQRTHQLDV
jgi:hypothetical protein